MKIVFVDERPIDLNEKKALSREDVLTTIARIIYEEERAGNCGEHLAQCFMIFGAKVTERLFNESED